LKVSIVLPDGRESELQVADIGRLRDSLRHFSGPAVRILDRKLAMAADTTMAVELDRLEAAALRKALEHLSGDAHSSGLELLYRDVAIALRRDARLEQAVRRLH
jgi:hypothetical protein